MREEIERVIAELEDEIEDLQRIKEQRVNGPFGKGAITGRSDMATETIAKLREVLANEQTNNSTE